MYLHSRWPNWGHCNKNVNVLFIWCVTIIMKTQPTVVLCRGITQPDGAAVVKYQNVSVMERLLGDEPLALVGGGGDVFHPFARSRRNSSVWRATALRLLAFQFSLPEHQRCQMQIKQQRLGVLHAFNFSSLHYSKITNSPHPVLGAVACTPSASWDPGSLIVKFAAITPVLMLSWTRSEKWCVCMCVCECVSQEEKETVSCERGLSWDMPYWDEECNYSRRSTHMALVQMCLLSALSWGGLITRDGDEREEWGQSSSLFSLACE